ncbi:MAG: hypothetical protein ABIF82_02535 [Planctomycetota bacterium]
MRRVILIAAALVIGASASGCGDRYESAVEAYMSHLKEVNDILAGVKDEASLKAAQVKLEELAGKIKAANERLAELPPPPKEKEEALKGKYEKEMRQAAADLKKNLKRLTDIEGGDEIGKVFKRAAGS